MTREPLVSVLLPARDEERRIARAIESILAQTLSDWELVVVDDGSRDRTCEVVERFTDSRIRIIHTRGVGLARALNTGLRSARSELVARQDADDWSLPRRLAMEVGFLAEHPEVVAVGAGWREVDASGNELVPRVPLVVGSLNGVVVRFNPITHTTVVFRRAAVEEVGGYDETLPFVEDYDLWLRLAHRGGMLWNLPDVLAVRTMAPGSVSMRHERRQAFSEVRLRLRHLRRTLAAGQSAAGQLRPLARRTLVLAAPLPLKRAVRRRRGKAP